MRLTRMRATTIASLASAILFALSAGPALASETMITCANPASGASWQIGIDYDKATVDSNRARIGVAEISWHDAKDGGNYTLDRNSGELTVVVASSTGGYFLHDRCQLEKQK